MDPKVDHLIDIVDEAEIIVAKAIQSGVPLWLNPSWKRIGPIWKDIRSEIDQKMDRRILQIKEDQAKSSAKAQSTEENAGEDTTPKDIATVLYEANMPRQDMMDEVITLLSAGHETTAHFMAFAAYTLGMFPDVQKKVKQEVDSVLGDKNIITKEEYVQMKYLQAFCNEALRWWNIVANIPREAADDIDLSSVGYNLTIPKGTTIVPSFAVCHRDEDFWGQDSTLFVPERWLNLKRDQNPAFFPFGFGKRLCIGQTMAQLEGACFIGLLVKKFKVTIPEGHKVKLWMAVTTKSETGTPVYLKEWTKEDLVA
jgi:cytochrome P450